MLKFFILLLISVDAFAFSKKTIVDNCKEKSKGACYEFSGRARVYNNNKYVRIWKKGTNRLYQIAYQTAPAFSELKHISMATEIHADFDVCFLQPETPSGISELCVQSVKNVKTLQMPE